MTGRYDEKVFEILNKQGLSESIQYYLFKKFQQKRYVFEVEEVWNLFGRYFTSQPNNPQNFKLFLYQLEKEKSKNVFDFGNKDCSNVMYFSMDKRFKLASEVEVEVSE